MRRSSAVPALAILALLVPALLAGCGGEDGSTGGARGGKGKASGAVVRVGHFPNVTHAHGLAAHALSRKGKGWFEARLGPGVKEEWFVYNAGPSAMEAMLSGALDLAYVGPNPVLNAHARAKGEEIRVLAGATRGGSALVVRGDGGIAKPEDFRGKRVATPQLGNTQDVACRTWLASKGFKVTVTGGDVTVVPTANPDQLALFLKGDVDAAWTVEPWVSRLENEGKGRVLLEEDDALTTVLASSAAYLKTSPDLAKRFLAAHRELTAWLSAHPAEAKELLREELKEETQQEVSGDLLDRCWMRMRFEDAVAREDFDALTTGARQAGLLDEEPDLSRLVEETR